MIRDLNPMSFHAFGTILPEKEQKQPRANHLAISLSAGHTMVYQTVADTWLGGASEQTVLSVSLDDQTYCDFYLDKTVQLRPGVWFSLTALQGKSSVQMAAILMPREIQTKVVDQFQVRQQFKIEALYSFLYQEKEQGFLFPGDTHPTVELTYVDKGTLHSVVDGQDLLLEQGDLVLYAPGQWHMQYADIGVAPRVVTASFTVGGGDFEAIANRKIHVSQKMLALLQQMLREQEQGGIYSTDMILSLLTVFLITLLREGTQEREKQPLSVTNSENRIIGRTQQYIAAHVREKLSVPIVAKNVQVSPSYLTALFQKHLQISPGEYLRRIKLQESKQMIREGNMNFTEIAQALQYSTVHHFSRQFKEKFGITPSEYAKSVR